MSGRTPYSLNDPHYSYLFTLLNIGVRAGGARGAAAPPKFGQLRFFGQKEKFGQSQFLKKFPCFFFEEIDIFYFNLKPAW